ncbi:hypothetical protein AA0121_g13479 [Alternaria tenuissima]|nr:hypothetical protein AA0121_g13479 [Alternaria tenuissima]
MDQQTNSEWNQFQHRHMNTPPLTANLIVNSVYNATALIDSGCLCYALVSRRFARQSHLERFEIASRMIEGIDGKLSRIEEVSRFEFDMHGHREVAYAYVINNMDEDVVLGKGWMDHQHVTIAPAKRSLFIHSRGIRVRCDESVASQNVAQVSATTFAGLLKRSRDRESGVRVFAASIADINKALAPKKAVDVKSLLPKHYQSYFELFNPKEAAKLPPHRGPGIDHRVELMSKDGQQPQPPWGPLYGMSRGELLVLRRELTSLLEKGFIRVSSSPASAPVLFARKPGGGLRLCIDYRALNAITKKDRYPLPLIRETLNNLSKAKWFTKLDVIAAFHKIRVAEGDEWKTAFRTRFGLFEWLVTPFGMANSPSTFQRYINWTLREYLDEFCSAYLDDVLIYTDGSLQQHQEHVKKVLSKLQAAGLHVDIKKCEFEVKSTKYLGFIIDAGKGIRMDPEKVKAIKEWEAPRTVKGVRSFLGFANFYRRFIRDFAKVATPLTRLTGDVTFVWGDDEQKAFDKLKEVFITEPNLAAFDPERDTVLECDSSGYAVGGVLSQYDDEGILRPCAFFSRKNNAHECNYEIHDKELLAVIRCLEEWDAELRSVKSFKVITDHKNLEYFMKPKLLSERQVRWAALLSRYNMEMLYRPGKENVRADALSRREQDMPEDAEDERLQKRIIQVLKPTSQCYEDTSEDKEDMAGSWAMSAKIRVGRTGPLPIPERIWKEISMDFIEKLPISENMRCLMVVTDRLGKGSIFIPLPNTETETVVRAYIKHVVAYHWLPDAITSDRGSQFVSLLWERLCEILKINRRLSTAFHPQTDGSTERMNSVWEAYIRAFISWAQNDWAQLCPMAQIAINGRDATSTGVSPFFLQHGYNVDPLQLEVPQGANRRKYSAEERSDREKAEAIAAKFRHVFELAQASMAQAQAEQEKQANKHRREARNFKVGDKVWLRLDKQYSTGRESRKLDWKNAKYTVIEVISSHAVKLDTPPGHHPVFHVDRLRLANTDPLPSQTQDDYQPLPLQVNGVEEYLVEDVVAEQLKRRGRGWKRYYDVKWKGYHQTSLEPAELLEETEALERWLAYTKDLRDDKGRLPESFRRATPSSGGEEGGNVMG